MAALEDRGDRASAGGGCAGVHGGEDAITTLGRLGSARLGSAWTMLGLLASGWATPGLPGSAWTRLGLRASGWTTLGLAGSVWTRLGLLASAWTTLGLPGSAWTTLGLLGSAWVMLGRRASCGALSLRKASPCRMLGLLEAACAAICARLWPKVARPRGVSGSSTAAGPRDSVLPLRAAAPKVAKTLGVAGSKAAGGSESVLPRREGRGDCTATGTHTDLLT